MKLEIKITISEDLLKSMNDEDFRKLIVQKALQAADTARKDNDKTGIRYDPRRYARIL